MTTPRTTSPENTRPSACENHSCGCAGASTAAAISPKPPDAGWTMFHIASMDCSSEEAEIRRAVDAIPGIRALRFQLSARTLDIQATEQALRQALQAIRKAGFDPQPLLATQTKTPSEHNAHDEHSGSEGGSRLIWALGLAIAAECIGFFAPDTALFKAIGLAVAAGAIAIGQWPEAAMVMALYAIAELIEARSVDRARNAIKGLLDLAPQQAMV